VKCGKAKNHADHAFGHLHLRSTGLHRRRRLPRAERAPRAAVVRQVHRSSTRTSPRCRRRTTSSKGNRFFRVFRALPDRCATRSLEDVIRAIASDGGRPMTNPDKVTRRALKQLTDAGNVARG
jgi:hypothetical protein